MSVRAWARHYQCAWEDRAIDRTLPAWLRVAALAYGSHRANGHAAFKPGRIGVLLGAPMDPVTGEDAKPMDKNNVQRAVRLAVQHGWLAEGSSSLCLIVPGHAIEGGLGYATEPCTRHGGGSDIDPPRRAR